MANGSMEPRTEMESNNGKMVLNTLEIGLTILCKELVTTSLPMEASMKVNGLIISSMDKEHKPGQMVELTKEHSTMELNKDKVYIHGLMVRNTMEIGQMANKMEKESSQLPREKTEEVSGPMELEQSGLKRLKLKLKLPKEKIEKNSKLKKSLMTIKTQSSITQKRSLIKRLSRQIIINKQSQL